MDLKKRSIASAAAAEVNRVDVNDASIILDTWMNIPYFVKMAWVMLQRCIKRKYIFYDA
jgi:hypothetical protein